MQKFRWIEERANLGGVEEKGKYDQNILEETLIELIFRKELSLTAFPLSAIKQLLIYFVTM